MSKIIFLRRKGLGAGSTRGISAYLNSCQARAVTPILYTGTWASILRNDKLSQLSEILSSDPDTPSMLIRWGTTTPSNVPLTQQLNVSSAIQAVNNKMMFRKLLQDNQPELVPTTVTPCTPQDLPSDTRLVLRPAHHSQGRNLFVTTLQDIEQTISNNSRVLSDGWYASELIDKVAEYRVYVVSGRVATVAQKTPDNPDAIAWNTHQGGRFDVVRWGDWPMEVCRVALEAFKYSGLDFSGVDVMVDREGRAYILELNSAPSLPLLSDGSVSYRQQCIAKTFAYIAENGKQHFDAPSQYSHWSDVIHPAVQ